ncbi:hypothetical protein [Rahnella sp. NRRL B-41462]|uniref:hypothetical protein n=1 Tax=Rahnella sp. NRRL B-41462 TaxID=1610579 RepID=UPI000DD46B8A|nr:hypothetical protein [Rahnella sp. NRRL B-41462]
MEPTTAPFDWLDLISKAAGPVIAAFIAAFLAAKFAVNRFYKEKWWEKRLAAFTEVIDLAYKLKMTEDYYLEVESMKEDLQSRDFKRHPPETERSLTDSYWETVQEIERIAQLSEFTLTSKASSIVNAFLKRRQSTRDAFNEDSLTTFEAANEDYAAAEDLLSSLVAEAKRELKVK